jgi:hypothetical protein
MALSPLHALLDEDLLSELATPRASTPKFAFPAFSFEAFNAMLHLSELSDQLDVTIESSKIDKTCSNLGRDHPKRCHQNKNHAVY